MDKQQNRTKNQLSRQKRILWILAVLAVLLAAAYGIIATLKHTQTLELPLYDTDGDRLEYTYTCQSGNKVTVVSTTEDTLTLSADSEITYNARPYIFPEIPLEKLNSVTVDNAYGKFTLYLDPTTGEYVFQGNEMVLYNAEPLSTLRLQARYMLAIQKVEGTFETDAALADFGLDKASEPVKVTVTDTQGASHTVLFGDALVTGAAYYAKDTQKPYVYVVDSTVEAFFKEENAYFDPIITAPLTQNTYQYMDTFSIRKNGEAFMESAIIPEEQRQGTGSTDLHRLTYPAGYSASLTMYYEALSCFENLTGSRVIETGVLAGGEEYAQELFDKYGLTIATNDVCCTYEGKEYRFLTGTRYNDADGNVMYYAYSPYMDTIVELPLANAPFLEYELIDFIDASAFQININNVSELTAHIPGVSAHFVLEGSGSELKVTETVTGQVIDTASFRQFFISLLTIKLEGYADQSEATGANEFGFGVSSVYGEHNTYEFDIISTTRDLLTLDGNAEFYVNRSYITAASERLMKLMRGETIAADY